MQFSVPLLWEQEPLFTRPAAPIAHAVGAVAVVAPRDLADPVR
jgi:hypothetical protein